jgi:hypothetical protein
MRPIQEGMERMASSFAVMPLLNLAPPYALESENRISLGLGGHHIGAARISQTNGLPAQSF